MFHRIHLFIIQVQYMNVLNVFEPLNELFKYNNTTIPNGNI